MITESLKLADVISQNILLVPVLNRFGIRPGVGEKSIKVICSQQGIHLKSFLAILNTYNSHSFFPKAEDVDMTVLVQFLRRTHTYYIDYTLPQIEKLLSLLTIDCPAHVVSMEERSKITPDESRLIIKYLVKGK